MDSYLCATSHSVGNVADAIKQWGGLMREYQAARVRLFTKQVVADLSTNATAVDDAKFKADYYVEQMAWLRAEWNATELPSHGVGDVVAISRRIQQRYESEMRPK